ncbi:MAG: PAS domain-containing protein, partial [Desulfobacterales bacterium]
MTETLNDSQSENPVFKRGLFDDFERLANHSQDAIYHYDIEPQLFLFHNQKFQIFFGLENQSESITTLDQVLQSIHPEDRQQLQKSFSKSLIGGHTEGEAEYRVLYSNGSIRWLHDRWIVLRDSKGKPISFQGFIRDNTQRKLSELQFIESKQNALIGSYIVQEGKFKYVNPKFINITGYSEEELINTDSMTIVREDYREHVRQCAVAMLKGENFTPYEFCVVDKSGSTHWIME